MTYKWNYDKKEDGGNDLWNDSAVLGRCQYQQ